MKKPPIDKRDVLARLTHAQNDGLLVRVRRWIPKSDRREGFVVGVGARWVALQRLSDRMKFDGWNLIRLKDIQAVSVDPDPDCFEIRALKARAIWPPKRTESGLDSVVEILDHARLSDQMVAVFDEFARPSVCWIGAVRSVVPGRLDLLEVNTCALWARNPRAFDPADVTRVDLGGGYEEALRLVAGQAPAA